MAESEDFYAGAFLVPTIVLLGVLNAAWAVWWVHPAWAWFVVPLGLPPIGMLHLWGLLLLVRYRPTKLAKHTDYKAEEWASFAVGSLVGPPLTYVLLWVLHKAAA